MTQMTQILLSIVIQSKSEGSVNIHKYIYVDVHEILPPFGRLNDNTEKNVILSKAKDL